MRPANDQAHMTWIETCSIPIKDRNTYVFIEYAELDVEDGAFTLRDRNGTRARIQVASLSCLMLGPGTSITHEAVKLASDVHCLLLWVGEHGVRLYSSGMPGGHRCDRLLEQARCALDSAKRLKVACSMYQYRFDEMLDDNLSMEQLRGKEAYRVKSIYHELSEQYGIEWNGRKYDASDWGSADRVNRFISAANTCLYGLCESAILIAGYSPSIGFIHYGRPRSFVYDVADLLKYETVVPVAFRMAADGFGNESTVRHECRELFRKENVLERLIPLINNLFKDSGIDYTGLVQPPDFSSGEGGYYSGLDNRKRSNATEGTYKPLAVRGQAGSFCRRLQLKTT